MSSGNDDPLDDYCDRRYPEGYGFYRRYLARTVPYGYERCRGENESGCQMDDTDGHRCVGGCHLGVARKVSETTALP